MGMGIQIEIESRHSDYGPDAGGYSVLRIDGVWIGRVDGPEARAKVKELADHLAAIKEMREALKEVVKEAEQALFQREDWTVRLHSGIEKARAALERVRER